ncbi:DUF6492 family protein [Enterovirga sp. CN4-39]|uniref:DUF6492 family protein n=1 Tax=Enterovirga sp. CN4-39 TaxID=3400910 RepID=UPI003BFBAF0A
MTREAGDALTYVTIVCRRDLAFLELQLRSMATFGASMQSARCLVIANGADVSLAREAKAAIDRVPTTPGLRFDVLPFSAVVPELDRTWGWRSQQILKLEVHRLVSTDWYVVLDAKNHFLRPFSTRDFVQEDGRGRIALQRHRGHMEPFLRASLREFGREADEYLERGFPTTTPLPLHTRTVSLLSAHLGAEGRGSINDYLEKRRHRASRSSSPITAFFCSRGMEALRSCIVSAQRKTSFCLRTFFPRSPGGQRLWTACRSRRRCLSVSTGAPPSN